MACNQTRFETGLQQWEQLGCAAMASTMQVCPTPCASAVSDLLNAQCFNTRWQSTRLGRQLNILDKESEEARYVGICPCPDNLICGPCGFNSEALCLRSDRCVWIRRVDTAACLALGSLSCHEVRERVEREPNTVATCSSTIPAWQRRAVVVSFFVLLLCLGIQAFNKWRQSKQDPDLVLRKRADKERKLLLGQTDTGFDVA
ncbi:MAG: hypothetical protein MHM6MM_003555 [Cercozoa sp. M6MM]